MCNDKCNLKDYTATSSTSVRTHDLQMTVQLSYMQDKYF